MLRAISIITALTLLLVAQAQSHVQITFTSDPVGATLSIATPDGPLEPMGLTPVTVSLSPGATYLVHLVAPEPYAAYNLYVPYEVMHIMPLHDAEISVWIERTTAAQQELQRNPPAPTPRALFSTPINSTTPSPRSCCRVCSAGKPCGNSCIARNKTCRQPAGCAC